MTPLPLTTVPSVSFHCPNFTNGKTEATKQPFGPEGNEGCRKMLRVNSDPELASECHCVACSPRMDDDIETLAR